MVDFAGGSCVVALALEVFRHCCVVPPDFAKVVLKVPAFNRIRPVEYNATYKYTKLASTDAADQQAMPYARFAVDGSSTRISIHTEAPERPEAIDAKGGSVGSVGSSDSSSRGGGVCTRAYVRVCACACVGVRVCPISFAGADITDRLPERNELRLGAHTAYCV